MSSLSWRDVRVGIETWAEIVRKVGDQDPYAVRLLLHVMRAHLIQQRAGVPGGLVSWGDPLVLDVQLAEIAWQDLSDEQRERADAELRSRHPDCPLWRCPLPVRYGQIALGRRPTWELKVGSP